MILQAFSNELLLAIAEQLPSERDLNAFARTNCRLYDLLNNDLYRHNILHNGCSAMTWAARTGQEATCRKLLDLSAGIEGYGATIEPLHLAAQIGSEAIVEMLLFRLTDFNNPEVQLFNALALAVERGHKRIVKLLLAHRLLNQDSRRNALLVASDSGDEHIVKLLIDHGAFFDEFQGNRPSPLWVASAQGHEGVVRLLLEQGANINESSSNSALRVAASLGRSKVVKLLLEKGADANAQFRDSDQGRTLVYNALGAASQGGHEDVVKILLQAGADIDGEFAQFGSALRVACVEGYYGVVDLLIQEGADVGPDVGGHIDNALCVAASLGHEEIVQRLLRAGAVVNVKSWYIDRALSVALSQGHEQAVELLTQHGGKIKTLASSRYSDKRATSWTGYETVVSKLRNGETYFDEQDWGMMLHQASCRGDVQVIRLAFECETGRLDWGEGDALLAASRSDNKKENILSMLLLAQDS
jgi:ankyrin repeat protein